MATETIRSGAELEALGRHQPGAVLLVSSPNCSVCTPVRAKLAELVATRFPRLQLAELDAGEHPELAAQQGIFSFPTVVVYMGGGEVLRRSRAFGMGEITAAIERPYAILAGD